jgi:ribosomal protein S18 acetylase RimI-like enzyme
MMRAMKLDDVENVVWVHQQSFTSFFLTFLGKPFLNELYAAIVVDPSGIALVSESDGAITGFVAGTDHPAGFYRRLLKQRWWKFGAACVKPILRNPSIAPRLLRAFSSPKSRGTEEECGTLMSLAVLPQQQGQGIGKALVAAFIEEAQKRQLKKIHLTTDKLNNDSANRFYQSLGFKCIHSYATPEKREMNAYELELSEPLENQRFTLER